MTPAERAAYNRAKEAERSRVASAALRDIGDIPPVKHPKRRKAAQKSFRAFCETYLKSHFPLAWSADHLKMIGKIEAAVLRGGQFAFAMPRASGKTTLCEAAVLWSILYGHRRFVVLVSATEKAATEVLETIKIEIETNDALNDDFPHACFPVRALEGINHRVRGQTCGGKPTRIEWTDKQIRFPTVSKSPSSGSVVTTTGITGRVRGLKTTTADGESLRPDLVILDDPQTDESARSPSQNATRERIISGAVLGLAGPKSKIAAVMPCTIIAPGDMVSRILDRDRSPVWQGERSKLMYSMPSDMTLWDKYASIRAEGLRSGDNGKAATEFYLQNRAAMDAGAEPAWPERFKGDEVSAVQSAMNLYVDNRRAFLAEYQNEPEPDAIAGQLEDLDADLLINRVTRSPRAVVPPDCTRLTAAIDVGGKVMWYAVVAWTEQYGGVVVDYGAYPRQNRHYFTAADARPSLSDEFPGYGESPRVYAGLKATVDQVVGRVYPRQDGGELRVSLCLVDSGWETDTVHQVCRQSAHSAVLLPSKGYGITASASPMAAWATRPGERTGPNWKVTPTTGGGRGRLAIFDSNHWKTFVAQRLLAPVGGPGVLQFFGEPGVHQMLCDHLTAEFRVRTTGRGRDVDEWKLRPERPDNHLFDCLVGASVAASINGLKWDSGAVVGEPAPPPTPRQKIKLSDLYKQKNGGQNR